MVSLDGGMRVDKQRWNRLASQQKKNRGKLFIREDRERYFMKIQFYVCIIIIGYAEYAFIHTCRSNPPSISLYLHFCWGDTLSFSFIHFPRAAGTEKLNDIVLFF